MAEAPDAVQDELARAQSALGRALGRARAGEDGALSQRVREAGEQLAHVLSGLVKLTRVHSADNQAFEQPAAEMARVLAVLEDLLGTVRLAIVEDQVYVNDVRVRYDARTGGQDLGERLARHEVGGLTFHAPLDPAAVRRLVGELAGDPAPDEPRAALTRRLLEAGMTTVEPEPPFRFRTSSERDRRPVPEQVLRRMHRLAEEALESLAAGRVLNPLPLRRAVVSALDADLAAPAFWAPPPPEVPLHAAHAVQVSMVALLLARSVGFSATFLQDLGIAALVHDAGYFAPGVAGTADAFVRHPLEGARVVLRQRGFQEGKLRRLRAVLEHHRDLRGKPAPSVTGAILRVAEDYDTLTRLHGGRVLRADILGAMLGAEAIYHAPLVQLLVNALGRHPPGTIVELEDGRRARVACPARGADLWEKPLVELIDPGTLAGTGRFADTAAGTGVKRALAG